MSVVNKVGTFWFLLKLYFQYKYMSFGVFNNFFHKQNIIDIVNVIYIAIKTILIGVTKFHNVRKEEENKR